MAKYNLKIELPVAGDDQYKLLNTELKKEAGKRVKLLSPAKPNSKENEIEYGVDGNISIGDLGSLVSKVSSKISRNFSFTILRQKAALNN